MGEGYLCFITYFKDSLCIEWAGPDPEEHPVLLEINKIVVVDLCKYVVFILS